MPNFVLCVEMAKILFGIDCKALIVVSFPVYSGVYDPKTLSVMNLFLYSEGLLYLEFSFVFPKQNHL